MKPFEKCLQEQLDALPDTPVAADGFVSQAASINSELKEAEAHCHNLRSNLQHTTEALNAHLAVEIRNRMPKLDVHLTRGKVDVRYKSRSLVCWPNFDKNVWEVEANETGRYFLKAGTEMLQLTDDVSEFVDAITGYFVGSYKTLQDVDGPPMGMGGVGGQAFAPNAIGAGRPIQKLGTQEPGTGSYA